MDYRELLSIAKKYPNCCSIDRHIHAYEDIDEAGLKQAKPVINTQGKGTQNGNDN